MWSVQPAGLVFFPLDEQLGLLPTCYSPFLVETMVRLGARLPFGQVADEMALLFKVPVSADTVRRLTEQAGAVQVTLEQQELERLEHEAPPEREGPAIQQVSADGAMVPLVGGRWAEARTIGLGTIKEGVGLVHATDLSYFARLCSADQFIRQATLPTYERGTRGAGTVIAVMDGASWLQELIEEQCPQAVRILDFAHAAGYLSQAATAALGPGSTEATAWFTEWRSKLKTQEPEVVLAALRALPAPTAEAATVRRTALRYLTRRREQITYAAFQERGYPIGSGMVESAGKLVIEARLKGSGMRWASRNVNPLLALRGPLCSGQWTQIWSVIWKAWRAQISQRQAQGRARRRALRAATEAALASPPAAPLPKPEREKTIVDGRPTATHPWKQAARAKVA
jgi:hypothetical protein